MLFFQGRWSSDEVENPEEYHEVRREGQVEHWGLDVDPNELLLECDHAQADIGASAQRYSPQ